MPKLLTLTTAKTSKGEAHGWLTAVLYLSPASVSGHNVCPSSVPECRAACLARSGRMHMPAANRARLWRTRLFFTNRAAFQAQLLRELRGARERARRLGLRLAFRPNGTSDLNFHTLLPDWRKVADVADAVYDYTKRPSALSRPYHTTLSYSGHNIGEAQAWLRAGRNVAVVFDTPRAKPLPRFWHNYPVLDGDTHDLRFLDPPGHIVGLRYKRIPNRHAPDFPTFVQRS